MDKQEVLNMLKTEPMFWSRLGFALDPTILDDNDVPVLISDDFERFVRTHNNFSNLGVKIHTSILHNGWVGVDKYDYRIVDKTLDYLLKNNSDIYYMPRIKLNVPIEWCKKYPLDVFLYENAPREAERIKELVGTLKHDYYGMESNKGYPVTGPSLGDRPNLNGLIGLQSFASEQWKKDASKALENLLIHLENGPYADRIIGYQIGFGTFGENVWWGCWNGHDLGFNWYKSNRLGDYSECGRRAFYEWGIKKYKTIEELESAWLQKGITSQNIKLPTVAHRQNECNDLCEFMRSRDSDKICADYEEFLSDVNVKALADFASVVKKSTNDKVVGTFYGYIIGIGNCSYSGHLGIDKLLECKDIDFIAAPKGYYRSGASEPGLEQAPMQSIGLKKLWIDELDNHTHLDKYPFDGKAENISETKSLLWREFSKNLSHNQGFWWMDLGIGWFDDDDVLDEIKSICLKNKQLRLKDGSDNIAEVLMLVDDRVMSHMKLSYGVSNFFIKKFASDVKMCGVPVDLYRLSDFEKLNIKKYKTIIFLNAFMVNEWERKMFDAKIEKGTTVIWNYAAGIIGEEFDFENVFRLTKMRVEQHTLGSAESEYLKKHITIDFPVIKITSECEKVKTYQDGSCMIGRVVDEKQRNIFLCCLPMLEICEIHDIIKDSGCHMYAPANCCVYGDDRFIFVLAGENIDGELCLEDKKVPLKLKKTEYLFLDGEMR